MSRAPTMRAMRGPSDVLAESHSQLDWGARRLLANGELAGRGIVLSQLTRALGAHIMAVERFILPALDARGIGVPRHFSTVFEQFKHHVATELAHAEGELAEGALPVLCLTLRQLQPAEERDLLPLLTSGMSPGERELLAAELDSHFEAWGEASPPDSLL